MSSPATIPRTFINMSASPTIDLTIPQLPVRRTPGVTDITDIIIISESEDENNDTSHRNNSNYHFNDNTNSLFGFDSQSIFNSSTRHSSNNIQDSSGNNTNYNLRSGLTGLGTNGSSSNRGTSTRPSRRPNSIRGFLDFMFTTVNQANNNNNHRHRHHSSAFHPYASTAEVLLTANYGTNNSSGSSRSPMTTFYDSNRANTNINSNDVQILNTPPRRRTNNSPKPPILSGHARDLDDSHTLICADCNELLYEKLWALSNCGHVVCGSCVDKYKYSEKKKIPCPSCKKTVNSKNILQLYV